MYGLRPDWLLKRISPLTARHYPLSEQEWNMQENTFETRIKGRS